MIEHAMCRCSKIKETILCIVMSTKWRDWDSNPRHQSDRLLKPAPHTTSPSWLYVLFSIAWIMVEDTVCRCSNKGKNTTYRNVNNMTGTGLEPKQPEWLVPETSALDHSVILPVYFRVISMKDGKTYHVQVFKIMETILYIVMSTKWQH